ncbi:MAG: hypothetical protein Q9226_000757 [Calogaya cf. arnoldii]
MSSAFSRIRELANRLHANVEQIDTYLENNKLPQPSFEARGPVDMGIKSKYIEACRIATIEDAMEIQDLLLGPKMLLRPIYNATSLEAIYKYGIAEKVPLDGMISYPELAQLCDIYEPDLRRVLRFAMCYHRAFSEPTKGFVAHSAASRAIVEKAGVRDALGFMFAETYQSFARVSLENLIRICLTLTPQQTVEAMKQANSQELNKTGWALAHNTELPFYRYLGSEPTKSACFAGAMQAFEDGPDISPSYLVENYPWSSVGTGLVVDVGGSLGSVCVAIAEAYPKLNFIVQDRPDVVEMGRQNGKMLCSSIAERIEFMTHDFFEQQVVEADIYLFRYIFHNWPDQSVIKILQQLIPSLKSGARVLINETLLPDPNTSSATREREVRAMDMVMLTLCNGRERDADDWKELFAATDSRLRFVTAFVPDGSSLGIIEAIWEG